MALSHLYKSTSGGTAQLVEPTERPGGVSLVNVTKATKTSAPHDLVELAEVVQQGDEGVKNTACSKLTVIAEQIQFLQEQAKKILEKAKRDSELHHAASNIVKKPGQIYYMYEKKSGQKFISIISPEEWGNSLPGEYLGGYRLEMDRSWTPISDIKSKDREFQILDAVLHNKKGIIGAAIEYDDMN